ncbi:hypothetical protein [Rhodoferax fermentans]|uniref:hypothetical protein n=1 Tax=Rhodoferax fermentans TaxID=28066 RepID=UPI001F5BAD40|nr:hypothetical protein [Rhodoferax fermentans]
MLQLIAFALQRCGCDAAHFFELTARLISILQYIVIGVFSSDQRAVQLFVFIYLELGAGPHSEFERNISGGIGPAIPNDCGVETDV